MEGAISNLELRANLRLSLHVPISVSGNIDITAEGSSQSNDPQFRALVGAILFSRRFIVTYQAVAVSLLVLFSAVHWRRKSSRWWKRRQMANKEKAGYEPKAVEGSSRTPRSLVRENQDGSLSSTSSSSSTLEGTPSPPSPKIPIKADERTPLLPSLESKLSRSFRSQVLGRLRAWIIYQPKPVSLINKTLPSNATSLVVLALAAVNIFYTLYRVPLTISMLFVFADQASLVFVANLPWLYLFAAKNQPIKVLTGYSYESLNIIHRQLGEIMCFLALVHSAGMIGVWYTLLRPGGLTLASFLLLKVILLGIGTLVAYEALYLTSLASFR